MCSFGDCEWVVYVNQESDSHVTHQRRCKKEDFFFCTAASEYHSRTD